MNFIQGQKFIGLADWIYAPEKKKCSNPFRNDINNIKPTDYRYLENTLDLSKLKDNDIIYTHTFYVDQLFELPIKKKVIVLTHNADTPADIIPPQWVKVWLSTNVNIRHDRVKSIPIGLENDIWFPEKKVKILELLKTEKKWTNLIYCNHNIKTNPEKRQKPYDILGGRSYATVKYGHNGLTPAEFLEDVYNHLFVICPEGNGIDTHRFWECLYLGAIPIVEKNINIEFYRSAPVLILNSFSDLSYFNSEIKEYFDSIKFDIDKLSNILNFDYWKKYVESFRA